MLGHNEQLPMHLDYRPPQLVPAGTNTTLMSTPATNQASFTAGQQIIVDLPARGYLNPTTLNMRYKYVQTSAVGSSSMIGCPLYTPFIRAEVYAGSTSLENLSQYNQIVGFLLANTQLSLSDKYSAQPTLGYNSDATLSSVENFDGRTMASSGETGYFSGPLINCLSNCERFIPLFLTGSLRIILTMDALSSMCTSTIPFTGFTISNFELTYELVDFPQHINATVASMPVINIKSQTFLNTAQPLASGISGTIDLVYNMRAQSVKSAFILFTGTSANSVNKWGDAWDPTSRSGEVSIFIGTQVYPSRPLSFLNNPVGVLTQLRQASSALKFNNFRSSLDKSNNMCIDSLEFNGYINDSTTASTLIAPSKAIIGIHLEAINGEDQYLLSGISTQQTTISVRLTTSTATVQAHNVNLILACDYLLSIDNVTGMTSAKI